MRELLSGVKKYNLNIAKQLKKIFTELNEAVFNGAESITIEEIMSALNSMMISNINYEDSKYNIYQQSAPQISNDQKLTLDENLKLYLNNFIYHLNNSAILKPYNLSTLLAGKFVNYLWSPLYSGKTLTSNHAAETLVIPVGEYGFENSLYMLLTTRVLLLLTDQIKDVAEKLETDNWSLLSQETFRGRKKLEQQSEGKFEGILSTQDTLKEGIQSFQAILSSLTAKKIGDLSFDQLLEKTIEEKLPQKIAATVPFNYTLPSIRQGLYFDPIFDTQLAEKNNKLKFTYAFQAYCKETQNLYSESRLVVDGVRNPGLLGTGCPVAKKQIGYDETGIHYIGKAYLKIYKLLQENLSLNEIKNNIYNLNFDMPQTLIQPIEQPDEFKANNVNFEKTLALKDSVSTLQQLYSYSNKILKIWFGNLPIAELPSTTIRNSWFATNPEFDAELSLQFGSLLEEVKQGKFLDCKRSTAQTLALIILLDQFSRNIYRNTPKMYEADELAIELALEIIDAGLDASLPPVARWFLYMPFQHAEDRKLQQKSMELFKQLHDDVNEDERNIVFKNVLKNAQQHKDIVEAFGRFPHRNIILDRAATQQENIYLASLKPGYYYNEDYFRQLQVTATSKVTLLKNNSIAVTATLLLSGLIYGAMSSENNQHARIYGLLTLIVGLFLANNYSDSLSNLCKQAGFFKPAKNMIPDMKIVEIKDKEIDDKVVSKLKK